MTAIVVDTNVFAIADGMFEDASLHCEAACVALMGMIAGGQPIAVDDADLIFTEYLRTLDGAKPGGKLVKRLHTLRFGGDVCHRVPITPSPLAPGAFDEVPLALRDFDDDDQKFIAVAAAAPADLYAGRDEDWWTRRADFTRSGLTLHLLCVTDMI